jgi:Cu/Ag efflux pump CusA
VVLAASKEVRNSIVYATALVAAVFLPIFFMPGVEGRLLISLGAAYLASLIASMVVSLTVTPVLSAILLNDKSLRGHEQETRIVQKIKAAITPWIYWCIQNVKIAVYFCPFQKSIGSLLLCKFFGGYVIHFFVFRRKRAWLTGGVGNAGTKTRIDFKQRFGDGRFANASRATDNNEGMHTLGKYC